jgi:6-phosphofructokinase 1
MPTAADLAVMSLGPCRIDSPLKPLLASRRTTAHSAAEDDRVFFHDTARLAAESGCTVETLPGFEPAGPRQSIFFDPARLPSIRLLSV